MATPTLRLCLRGAVLSAALILAPAWAQELPSFQLTIKAGRFYPDVIEVPAHTKFRLLIRNEGPGPEEFESQEPRKEKVLAPGVQSFLIYQPLRPGSYPFFGEFHPETAQGRLVAK